MTILLYTAQDLAAIGVAPSPARRLCRHCNKVKSNRPRGLCWHCYYCPGVRELYGPVSKFGRRGITDFNGCTPLPVPTNVLPGSPEKLALLEQRAALRLSLFHPDEPFLAPAPKPVEARPIRGF